MYLRPFVVRQLTIRAEYLLTFWSSQTEGLQRDRLDACRVATRVALIGDSITQIGIERWYALQTEQGSEPKTPDQHIVYMQSQIENLFEILPAIRGLRQEDLLSTESRAELAAAPDVAAAMLVTASSSGPAPAEPESSTTSRATSADRFTAVDLIEDNIERVKRISLPSPLVEKNRKALEEWGIEASFRRGFAQKSDSAEVRKVQKALAVKLGTYIAQHICSSNALTEAYRQHSSRVCR